jgi:hypothetical protein
VFLAHFTGGGIGNVLDLEAGDFWACMDEAMKLYKVEAEGMKRVVLAGVEK